MLFDVAPARRRDHLGAGVHQHHGGERLARALGDAAHLLEVGWIELLDLRHQPIGAMLQLLPIDAVLQERLGVHLDAAPQPVGRRLAVGAAALARAAGKIDQREVSVVGHGCPSSAWRKRSYEGEFFDHYFDDLEHRALPGAGVLDQLGHFARLAHGCDIGDAAALGDQVEIGAGA